MLTHSYRHIQVSQQRGVFILNDMVGQRVPMYIEVSSSERIGIEDSMFLISGNWNRLFRVLE